MMSALLSAKLSSDGTLHHMSTRVLDLKPASLLQSFSKLLSKDTAPRIAFVVAAIGFSNTSPRFRGVAADESLESTLPFDPVRGWHCKQLDIGCD